MQKLFVAIAIIGLAAAGQTYAQQGHADHAAAAEETVTVKDVANPTNEECKSVMGRKMEGRVMHDHASVKGMPGVEVKKPLSKAEMDKMHSKCAAKMEAAKK